MTAPLRLADHYDAELRRHNERRSTKQLKSRMLQPVAHPPSEVSVKANGTFASSLVAPQEGDPIFDPYVVIYLTDDTSRSPDAA